jgi:mannose-6-phosphate isomerase
MLVKISNTPRNYPWGSQTAIAAFLGKVPSGDPEAELWLGAHAGSPAQIIAGGTAVPPYRDLAEWVSADPVRTLGDQLAASRGRLPFLLKILAADSALSLQAHPTAAQAQEGFAFEESIGVALDAENRNYKDDSAKPEIIVALSETFDALSGFRPIDEAVAILDVLQGANEETENPDESLELLTSILTGGEPLRVAVETLLGGNFRSEVSALVKRVCDLARSARAVASPYAESFDTVTVLAAAFPDDPGVVISLLLNRVTLKRGEALFLDAGNIHAYLGGLGIEIMSASDNVLRGGLTTKHVDVLELIDVLDFTAIAPPRIAAVRNADGVDTFDAGTQDFVLHRVEAPGKVNIIGPAVVIVEQGSLWLTGLDGSIVLARGESVFATPEEKTINISGEGTAWVATIPSRVGA